MDEAEEVNTLPADATHIVLVYYPDPPGWMDCSGPITLVHARAEFQSHTDNGKALTTPEEGTYFKVWDISDPDLPEYT